MNIFGFKIFEAKQKDKEINIIESKKVYNLQKFWDEDRAEYRYRLGVGLLRKFDDGTIYIGCPFTPGCCLLGTKYHPLSVGDYDWMLRNAKHYKIPKSKV